MTIKTYNETEIFGTPLTAKEIELFDALTRDNMAAKQAFEVAYNFYMNRLSEHQKKVDKFWNQIGTVRGIKYNIKYVRGDLSIAEETEKEERNFKAANNIF